MEIYFYKKLFTKSQADSIGAELSQHDIHCVIKEHNPRLIPDAIFIGACVPADHARLVLCKVPYHIKYIYRLDYLEIEGGDPKGFKIGIGYSSLYNKDDTDIRCIPIPLSPERLNRLKNPQLNNTEFHNLVFQFTNMKKE